jgi:hypothetical protein
VPVDTLAHAESTSDVALIAPKVGPVEWLDSKLVTESHISGGEEPGAFTGQPRPSQSPRRRARSISGDMRSRIPSCVRDGKDSINSALHSDSE